MLNLKRLTPKQLDDLAREIEAHNSQRRASHIADQFVWLIFSLAGVTLICVVWAFTLPMFAATGARNANVLGLALTYLVAVLGGAYGLVVAQPNGKRVTRWLGWAGLLAVLLIMILFAEIHSYCMHASCRPG